eukprot:gene43665-4735_t
MVRPRDTPSSGSKCLALLRHENTYSGGPMAPMSDACGIVTGYDEMLGSTFALSDNPRKSVPWPATMMYWNSRAPHEHLPTPRDDASAADDGCPDLVESMQDKG